MAFTVQDWFIRKHACGYEMSADMARVEDLVRLVSSRMPAVSDSCYQAKVNALAGSREVAELMGLIPYEFRPANYAIGMDVVVWAHVTAAELFVRRNIGNVGPSIW